MSLIEQDRKDWDKKLRKETLEVVRIKWSQGDYNDVGSFGQRFIEAWIKNEEEKRLLLPSKQSNIIAISAAIISLISLVVNIALIFFRIK